MVSIRHLSKTSGDRSILKDINLEVAQAEILAIMGSSGGGKTTLLRCVSGLIDATQGDIEVDGVNVRTDPDLARCRMGMVFQSSALFDFMNVEDNVMFGVTRQKKRPRSESLKIARDALKSVGLVETDYAKMPSELSGGMRKRVGMARALALNPTVMLYDEPTTGLDPITTYSIDSLVKSVRDEFNVTSLVVSHDVNSVVRIADRVAFLHSGEVIFTGTPAEFLVAPDPNIRELVEKSRASVL